MIVRHPQDTDIIPEPCDNMGVFIRRYPKIQWYINHINHIPHKNCNMLPYPNFRHNCSRISEIPSLPRPTQSVAQVKLLTRSLRFLSSGLRKGPVEEVKTLVRHPCEHQVNVRRCMSPSMVSEVLAHLYEDTTRG